jgi:hypothetical protein
MTQCSRERGRGIFLCDRVNTRALFVHFIEIFLSFRNEILVENPASGVSGGADGTM